MARLRSLLHQSEKEAEKSRDLLNTARIEAERLQGSDAGVLKKSTPLGHTSALLGHASAPLGHTSTLILGHTNSIRSYIQGCDDSVGRDGIQDGTGRVFSIPLESLLSRGTGRVFSKDHGIAATLLTAFRK